MQGKIIKIISNDFTVLCDDNTIHTCKARGKFRNQKIVPLVGDYVKIDLDNNYIMEVLPRKNELLRPAICNIDQVFIIASTTKPEFDTNLLDKLLVIAEYNLIKPVICLTKLDLLTESKLEELKPYFEYYKKIGYEVVPNTDLDKIKTLLKDKITVFTGQSGAGKSTLLNRLEPNFNIKTNEISDALGRGKHTTRHTELLNTNDGWVADTPGFSSLDLTDIKKEEIKDAFLEFRKITCPYQDCFHLKEKECLVKKEVESSKILLSRYENYTRFINEGR